MSLAAEMAYGLRMLIADQGSTVTLRNVTTLTGVNPAPNPPTYEQLKVDGAVLAGVSAISMIGNPFTGRVIIGDKFTIAGDLTEYTVSAETISLPTADTLLNVPFTPMLAANAADEALVTFTAFAADSDIQALITDYPSRLKPPAAEQRKDLRVRFLDTDLPTGVTPSIGDHIIFSDGDVASVIEVEHAEMGGVHYGWFLRVSA